MTCPKSLILHQQLAIDVPLYHSVLTLLIIQTQVHPVLFLLFHLGRTFPEFRSFPVPYIGQATDRPATPSRLHQAIMPVLVPSIIKSILDALHRRYLRLRAKRSLHLVPESLLGCPGSMQASLCPRRPPSLLLILTTDLRLPPSRRKHTRVVYPLLRAPWH